MATSPAPHRRTRWAIVAVGAAWALVLAGCSGGGTDENQVATGDSAETAGAGEGGSLEGLDAGRAIGGLIPEETTTSTDTTLPPETTPATPEPTAPPQTSPPQTAPPVTIGAPPTTAAGAQPSPVDPGALSADEQVAYNAVVGVNGPITPEAELVNRARSLAQSGTTYDPNLLGSLAVNWSYINQAYECGTFPLATIASNAAGRAGSGYSYVGVGVSSQSCGTQVTIIVAR